MATEQKADTERRWTIYVCPICGEQRPGPEEGEMDLTQPDDERDDEGYLICDGWEEHEPVRFAPVEVVELSALEKEKAEREAVEAERGRQAEDAEEQRRARLTVEKKLSAVEHVVRALLAERRRAGTGSSLYLPDNPVTRERLDGLAAALTDEHNREESK